MSYLYVCEQGASIGLADNRFQVKYKDGMISSIEECLKRGVNMLFYSTNGAPIMDD